jgi:hypothetical protein
VEEVTGTQSEQSSADKEEEEEEEVEEVVITEDKKDTKDKKDNKKGNKKANVQTTKKVERRSPRLRTNVLAPPKPKRLAVLKRYPHRRLHVSLHAKD